MKPVTSDTIDLKTIEKSIFDLAQTWIDFDDTHKPVEVSIVDIESKKHCMGPSYMAEDTRGEKDVVAQFLDRELTLTVKVVLRCRGTEKWWMQG